MRVPIPLPWEVALQSQSEVLAYVSSKEGKRFMKAFTQDRFNRHGRHAATPTLAAFQHVVDDLLRSEPIYITEEMQDLCYAAMETFDRKEPMIEEDFFLKTAFVYLDRPFYTIDIAGKRLAWRAISWHVEDMTFSTSNEVTAGEVIETQLAAGVRIVLWARIDDPDDFQNDLIQFNDGLKWSIPHATTFPLFDINSTKDSGGDMLTSWLTFLRVMNRLMAEKITVSKRYRASRAERRRAQRINLNISDVNVVELRRRSQPSLNGEHEAANYSHRFIVKEHWRWQWYPSVNMHKQKFIESYVKGDPDLPLVIKKRIWLWDR